MPIPAHVATRARVDRARARAALAGDPAAPMTATDAELDAALAGVDQDAVFDTERAPWTVRVWDRRSPVNGASADYLLSRGDVPPTGDVYLLERGGTVVGFQPHEPDRAGVVAIPAGQGPARGAAHADRIAADNAAAEVLRRVRAHITTARGGTA